MKISPTDMNLFYTCPRAWKYHTDGKPGIYVDETLTLLGKAIHQAIEEFYTRIGERVTARAIEKTAEDLWREKFEELPGDIKRRANRCWRNFVAFEKWRLKNWEVYPPTFVEKRLENDEFVGVVDFYSRPEETVIDWKTGGLTQLGDEELRQGKIYQILLEDNGFKVREVLFVLLLTGRVLEMPLVTRGWIEKEREGMLRMIKEGRFPRRVTGYCKNCPYRLDCEFSDMRLWWEVIA